MLENKRKRVLIVVGLLIVCFLVIGVSYAVWQLTLVQTDKNVVTTGCFKVEFTDQNPITLDKAYPMSDEEGKSNTPYEFTLTNTCDSEATYYINLETITSAEKKLNEKHLKASLKKGEEEVFLSTLNSSYINLDKVIADASNAYKLYQGVLKSKETATFHLNLWLDEDTPTSDEVMNATYEGKVAISTSYSKPKETDNMMVAMNTSTKLGSALIETTINDTYTQNQKYLYINEINFESEIHPYLNALEVVDFSVAQDESVLGYYVNDESKGLVLHIQANGKIKANPNASFYGVVTVGEEDYTDNLITINGLENLDTSLVTDMSCMFCGRIQGELDLSSLDTSNVTNMSAMLAGEKNINVELGHWNTSKVTNMSHMFHGVRNIPNLSNLDTSNVTDMSDMFRNTSLEELNVNKLDTTKVTNMSRMFYMSNNITNLDLSNFNTSKVTNMSHMFASMNNLTSLNVSSFDTTNVTDMSYMFSGLRNITSLDLSSLKANKVTNMSGMFSDLSLQNLDLSHFDTRNVTDMSYMFLNSSNLNAIAYGDNFIHNQNASISSIYNMYKNCPANKPTHESWSGVSF